MIRTTQRTIAEFLSLLLQGEFIPKGIRILMTDTTTPINCHVGSRSMIKIFSIKKSPYLFSFSLNYLVLYRETIFEYGSNAVADTLLFEALKNSSKTWFH